MQSDAATTSVSFHGFVKDHYDALLLITAARLGFIPRFRRRLNMTEQRALICSGAVFLWTEEESCMKRWTDGYPWSPSRIYHEFLLYREMAERGCARSRTSSRLAQNDTTEETLRSYDDRRRKAIRILAGSLFNGGEFEDLVKSSTSGIARSDDVFKRGGLMKKTYSLSLPGETWHLVSYYTLEDVLASRLPIPKETSFLKGMSISEDLQAFYTLSARRQSLGACMHPLSEPSPPPPAFDSLPQVTNACYLPVVADIPGSTFSTDEWHDTSTYTTYAVTQSSFGCNTIPYGEDDGRCHYVDDPAVGWYAFG